MSQPRTAKSLAASVASLAFGFVVVAITLVGILSPEPTTQPTQAELGALADSMRAPVVLSPAYVFEQHADECWTIGQDGGIPTAAIVQDPDGVARFTVDRDEVDGAFSEVLNTIGFDDEPTTGAFSVIALCNAP